MAEFAPSGVSFEASNFKAFEKTIKAADKLLKGWNKTITQTTKSMNKLEAATKKFATAQSQASTKLTQAGRKWGSYERSLQGVSNELNTLNSDLTSSGTKLDQYAKAQDKATKSTKSLNTQLRKSDSTLRTFNSGIGSSGLSQFSSGLASSATSSRTFKDSMAGVSDRLSKIGSDALTASNNITSLVTSLGKKAVVGAGLFAVAAGAAGVASVGVAASFETAFTGVGKTVDGLVVLGEDGFLQLTEAGQAFQDGLKDLAENEIPLTFEELSKVAELGGQLGFTEGIESADEAQKALLAFTETIAGLAEATDLTTEAAAQDLSRFANIFESEFEDPGDNIRRIGNTIVELGNTSATTESQIVSFATRMAGAAQTAGLSQADVLGISAAFSSIGITAEAGGTAVSRVLLEMQKAANTSADGFVDNTEAISENERKIRDLTGELLGLEQNTGLSAEAILAQQKAFVEAGGSVAGFGEQLGDTRQRKLLGMIEEIQNLESETQALKDTHGQEFSSELLQNFLDITGTTKEEFQELQQTDPAGLFTKLVEGLAAEGDNASTALEGLGFNTAQITRAMLGMAGNTELLTDSLATANEEFANGSALSDEVEKRYATFDSRLQLFQNTIRNTAAEIGTAFLPAIANMLESASGIVDVFGERVPEVFEAVSNKIGELQGLDVGEFDLTTAINTGFDTLIATINEFDVTPIQTALDTLSTDVFPVFIQGIDFVIENWALFEGALIGLGIAAGIAVTISTLATIGAGIAALLSPIGLVVTAIVGLTAAWNANLFGIQETTQAVFDTINGLIDSFSTGGLEGAFDFLQVPEGIQDSISGVFNVFSDFTLPESFENLKTQLDDLFSGESFETISSGAAMIGEALSIAGAAIGGFAATLAVGIGGMLVDQLTGAIDVIASFIGVLDSLLDKDYSSVGESLGALGESILTLLVKPLEAIPEAFLGVDLDFVTPIQNALTTAAEAISGFVWPTLSELDFSGIGLQVAGFGQAITNALGGALSNVELGELTLPEFSNLSGILSNIDLGTLEFPDILGAVDAIKDGIISRFTNIFSGIDLGLPDFTGFGDFLPELSLPQFEGDILPSFADEEAEAREQGENLGKAIGEGQVEGLEESEKGFIESAGDFFKGGWEALSNPWQTGSPSKLTIKLGQDIGTGLGIGLKDTKTLRPALDALNRLMTQGLEAIAITIRDDTNPALEDFTDLVDNLATFSIPTLADMIGGLLLDALTENTSAVEENTALSQDLSDQTQILTAAYIDLAFTVGGIVVPAFLVHNVVMLTAENLARRLERAIKKLTERYLALAAAISKASQAGTGVPTGITGNEPVPAGSFAEGGSFTVPNTIPPKLQGPTGGMMIEVHPKELVNIIPAPLAMQVPDSTPLSAPQFSGATIAPSVGAQTTNNNDNTAEYHLHINEAVSSDFRGNFGFLTSMGRRR